MAIQFIRSGRLPQEAAQARTCMSIDVYRRHIIPIEALPAAFEALAEIAVRRRNPHELPVILPGGATAILPYAPDDFFRPEIPFDLARSEEELTVVFGFRVGFDSTIEEYVEQNPEPPFGVVRSRHGVRRALFGVLLSIYLEPPFALIEFSNTSSSSSIAFGLEPSCEVMDYVGRCADRIVTYWDAMGHAHLVWPIEGPWPDSLNRGERSVETAAIVDHVRRLADANDLG